MNKKRIYHVVIILCLAVTALIYTGCRRNDRNNAAVNEGNGTSAVQEGTSAAGTGTSATNNNDNNGMNNNNDNNGVDIGEDIGRAADDVANGVGRAVGDMAGVNYGDYDSAHEYLMGQIGGANNNGRYEVRNENRELTNYDTANSGRRGYRYEIYDTSKGNGEKYGVFYVDQETGKIYKETGKDKKIEEYRTK